jgi:hypothetical protein
MATYIAASKNDSKMRDSTAVSPDCSDVCRKARPREEPYRTGALCESIADVTICATSRPFPNIWFDLTVPTDEA